MPGPDQSTNLRSCQWKLSWRRWTFLCTLYTAILLLLFSLSSFFRESKYHPSREVNEDKRMERAEVQKKMTLTTTMAMTRITTPFPTTKNVQTARQTASSQSPIPTSKKRLNVGDFKAEPRWDIEDQYRLEEGSLQTNCPNSVKVKAAQSFWLQEIFLPNLTLFLDMEHFNLSEWDRLEHFKPPFGFMGLDYSMVREVLEKFPPISQQQLLLAAHPRTGSSRCISCAVVGNGGILKKSQVGQEIDSHDYVFRVNGAVINGYEKDVGTRTSFYGFTFHSLAMSLHLLEYQGFHNVPMEKDIHYLHFLEGKQDFEWLEYILRDQKMKKAIMKRRYLLMHPDLLRYMKNRFLRSKVLDTIKWTLYRPSTGALLLLTAIQLCDKVSAYGFITNNYHQFSDHYYDPKGKKLDFYLNHDFLMEKRLWKQLHNEGTIQLYQGPKAIQN